MGVKRGGCGASREDNVERERVYFFFCDTCTLSVCVCVCVCMSVVPLAWKCRTLKRTSQGRWQELHSRVCVAV